MHDEEVGILDIELYRLKEALNRSLLSSVSIDQILGGSAEYNLPGDGDLGVFFEADGSFGGVSIVEDNSHAGLSDASLTTLVDEVLEVSALSLLILFSSSSHSHVLLTPHSICFLFQSSRFLSSHPLLATIAASIPASFVPLRYSYS